MAEVILDRIQAGRVAPGDHRLVASALQLFLSLLLVGCGPALVPLQLDGQPVVLSPGLAEEEMGEALLPQTDAD